MELKLGRRVNNPSSFLVSLNGFKVREDSLDMLGKLSAMVPTNLDYI